ncbi:DUF4398 domain-containing protein [Gilvimarinus algae]|uniref:DUF4398 domain-containing protein n=1 Tax=Gilvimarinus algae TaxID=3058037 RepID=A0ABT8TLI3_9GAMM|nr:DUF4398 domain-containing protein [Gilvimarinus sp. SDUM040014]MDO3383486.1 DUF4398 domain-containing protein [Gilvimarinus sp. SDUM040014]
MKRLVSVMSLLLLSMVMVGCATQAPVPDTLLTQTESRIEQAKSLNAERHAPVVFRDAQKHLNSAKTSIEKEQYVEARQYLEKSLADVELAIATSNAAKSKRASEQVEENLRVLERELR